MDETLYSIRMHAAKAGGHLSGAERIVAEADLEQAATALLRRAMDHGRGKADELRLSIDALAGEVVRRGRLPDLRTVDVPDHRRGREAAIEALTVAGVDEEAARSAVAALAAGAAPDGGVMRGAMLVDAASGERREPDRGRGVRVSRMDLSAEAAATLRLELRKAGLDNDHVLEALVLAGKVLAAPGIVAELCWSDDPDYTAGYVCCQSLGYVRFPHLKPAGEIRGGRAFFLAPDAELPKLIDFLERTALLIDELGAVDAAALAGVDP